MIIPATATARFRDGRRHASIAPPASTARDQSARPGEHDRHTHDERRRDVNPPPDARLIDNLARCDQAPPAQDRPRSRCMAQRRRRPCHAAIKRNRVKTPRKKWIDPEVLQNSIARRDSPANNDRVHQSPRPRRLSRRHACHGDGDREDCNLLHRSEPPPHRARERKPRLRGEQSREQQRRRLRSGKNQKPTAIFPRP